MHRTIATDDAARLFSSPGGLNSFLSTFNYTLYIVAFLQPRLPPLTSIPQVLLNFLRGNGLSTGAKAAPLAAAAPAAPTGIAALAVMLSGTRTTLRLFGLFPMYVWARQLLKGPQPGQDRQLYAIAVAQCSAYMSFQALENIALLIDRDVLPKNFGARQFNKGVPFVTQKVYLWAYRSWMIGVLCDFPRLIREAVIEREKRSDRTSGQRSASSEEDRKVDEKWWSDLIVPCAWLPVAVHFSKEGGVPGMNLGIMGACGALAGLGRTAGLWAATKDV